MAGADDNAILAGRGGGARMCPYEANGVKGTNMVSTTHSKRENGNVKGTAKDRAGGLFMLCQPVQPVVAQSNLCENEFEEVDWVACGDD